MMQYQQSKSTGSKHEQSYSILRPLLSLSKDKVYQLCDYLSVPFHEDPTNKKLSTSKRNIVRQVIIPQIAEL
jgi:tRNA(Ile)-lysidine synthase TilS/MesJ